MVYEASDIAKYFLSRSIADNIPVTNLKLQKLIYMAHGFYLAVTDQPLLSNPVECWPYGPVINDTYHEYKNFGNQTITIPQADFYKSFNFDKETLSVLDFTWENCKNLDAIQLSNWTHIDGSPWKRTMDENKNEIPNDYIRDYFKRFLNPPQNDTGTTAAAEQ